MERYVFICFGNYSPIDLKIEPDNLPHPIIFGVKALTSLDNAIIGKIVKNGERFELFLDPDNAYAYLEGKKKDLKNILVVEEVFKDAKKGERQSPSKITAAFGTSDVYVVLKEVLEHGEVPLTTAQRKKMIEDKRKRIISIIARNAIDVRTKAPVPEKRIEMAMEEAKVHIDPFKKPEEQVNDVLSALKLVLPLKFEKVQVAVKVPSQYAIKVYSILHSYSIKKEEWTSQGDLIAVVEIPAGIQGEVYERLAKLTNGEVQTKLLERGV